MEKYWIEIKYRIWEVDKKRNWFWQIKCINGRVKASSNTLYPKKCLCLNDANSFAKAVGLGVR